MNNLKCIFLEICKGGRCINLPGSFKCTCASGFIGSGKQCASTKCQEPRKPPGAEIKNCSNSKCEYQCKEGYQKVDGKEMQQCDWRGKWPMDTLIQCEGKLRVACFRMNWNSHFTLTSPSPYPHVTFTLPSPYPHLTLRLPSPYPHPLSYVRLIMLVKSHTYDLCIYFT